MWSEGIEVLNPHEALKEANEMENENLRMDAFFDCVNQSERSKTRKKADRKNVVKILYKSLMLFGFALIMATFGVVGIVANWFSFVVALVLSHFSTYYFGKFVAIFKGSWRK